ncbi:MULTISPECIES: hypothetical protein [Kordiimonas]|jgi:hypothetical protein|uniref:hypothetical protein n=1 Tax=Kordiimonas TaxID=288021 RepID=UPI00257E879D|nr:hypothetical protein [Kordiimonas sp. UBA4487]
MTGVKMLAFVGFILMAAGLMNGYQANRDMENKMKRLVENVQPILPATSADGRIVVDRVTYDHKGLTMYGRLLVGADQLSPKRLRAEVRAMGRLPLCDHPGIIALLEMGAELRLELGNQENYKIIDLMLDQERCTAA